MRKLILLLIVMGAGCLGTARCDQVSNHTLGNHSDRYRDTMPVPEPGAILLFGAGLIGYGILVRKRK